MLIATPRTMEKSLSSCQVTNMRLGAPSKYLISELT